MKKALKFLGKSLLLLFTLSVLSLTVGINLPTKDYEQKEQQTRKLLIENCSIIDIKNGLTVLNQDICVENGIITAVGSGLLVNRNEYKIIEGKNKFVMPTLWDMHIHTLSLSPQLHFPLLIANGVTAIRDMGDGDSWISDIDAPLEKDKVIWEKAALEHNLLMPNVWESCSYHVEEVENTTIGENSEVVEALVSKLKARGEPFIKLQLEDSELPENVFYEIQKQGNLQGIKVLGHLSYNVDIGTVLKNGYPTIEHAWALIPHFVKEKKRFEKDLETKKYELLNQDPLLTQSVLELIRESNTYYVPTHVSSNRKEILIFERKFTQNPLNRYIEGIQLGLWKLWGNLHTSGYDKPEQQKILSDYYQKSLEVTKLAQIKGVKIMAGTDALDRYVYHGFSLHDELQEMVKAGLSNAEALRTATINPAEYYGKSAVWGSIEVGKKADLLLLSSNPLESISNTTTIESVYFNQRLYSKNELEAMKSYVYEQAGSFRISCHFIWNMIKGII